MDKVLAVLSHPAWQGVGAVVAIVVAVLPLFSLKSFALGRLFPLVGDYGLKGFLVGVFISVVLEGLRLAVVINFFEESNSLRDLGLTIYVVIIIFVVKHMLGDGAEPRDLLLGLLSAYLVYKLVDFNIIEGFFDNGTMSPLERFIANRLFGAVIVVGVVGIVVGVSESITDHVYIMDKERFERVEVILKSKGYKVTDRYYIRMKIYQQGYRDFVVRDKGGNTVTEGANLDELEYYADKL